MALGIKINCDNCRECCAKKLERWKCEKIFAPTREALIARIHELQRRIAMLEELKDIEIVITHSDIVEDLFINA